MDHGNGELIKIFGIADTDDLKIGNLKEENCHISSKVLAGVTAAGVAVRRLQLVQCIISLFVYFLFGRPHVAFPQKQLHCKLM